MAEIVIEDRPRWAYRNAWAGHAAAGRHGRLDGPAGVRIRLLDCRGLGTLAVARGREADLADRLHERGHPVPPAPGRCAFGARFDLVWSGPGQWLVVADDAARLPALARDLADLAVLVEQGDGRALLSLEGPNARDVLAKGFAIDLHPDVFTDGASAATAVAHLSVQLWRRGEAYRIAGARSACGSVWSWLMAAAAEYGCTVEEG